MSWYNTDSKLAAYSLVNVSSYFTVVNLLPFKIYGSLSSAWQIHSMPNWAQSPKGWCNTFAFDIRPSHRFVVYYLTVIFVKTAGYC